MADLRTWFLATRPWSFSMSLITVTLGTVWALDTGVSWALYAASAATMVSLQAATNLFNDYFDVKNEVDVPDAPTAKYRPHPLVQNELSMPQVLRAACFLCGLGVTLGIILGVLRGWPVLAIGMTGALLCLAYTARPFALKYHALGEFTVFTVWGPLAMLAAYYVQAQRFSGSLILVSAPFGILVAMTLLANNIRDIDYDRRQGIRTLAAILGLQAGKKVFAVLIALSFLLVAAMALTGPLSPWAFIVLAAAPIAISLCRMMFGNIPEDADARVAKLDVVFGVLLIAAIALQRLTG